MKLRSLTLRNVRVHEELTLDLTDKVTGGARRLVLLVGPNGSGKTTILRAVVHLLTQWDARFGGESLGPNDARRATSAEGTRPAGPSLVEAVAEFDGAERQRVQALGYSGVEVAGLLSWPLARMYEAPAPPATIMEAPPEDGLPVLMDEARALAISGANPPGVFLAAKRGVLPLPERLPANLERFDSRLNALSTSRDRFETFGPRLALAEAAPDVYDPEKRLARLWSAIEKCLPDFPKRAGVEGLRLRLKNRFGYLVWLEDLSDGERALLLLLMEVAIRRPTNGIVLIDELEQHLHPRWQRDVLDALFLLEPTAQFIITTQSPYLAACAPDDVYSLGSLEERS